MGRLIYSMMVSLDGYVETRDRELDWAIVDEEVHRFANAQTRGLSAILYGRRLYELMAGFWPTADEAPGAPEHIAEFARIWRPKPKVVYSKTLDTVEWNSRLVREVVVEEVEALKREYGYLEVGGPNLAATFIRLGLVDEYGLYVNPVVLSGGTPFFQAGVDRTHLRLVESRTFSSGVVFLRYERPDR
jgi:dihydrofolate reductase